MEEAEFDRFADEYRELHERNIRLSGEAPEYFAEYKVVDVLRHWRRAARGDSPRVLDFGAGVGYSVPFFAKHLPSAQLTCLDVSDRSLEIGRSRFGGQAEFVRFDGASIPYAPGTFDIGFASCVFHHIPHDRHATLLGELRRVLKPGGLLLIFEHNPLNPLTLQAVNSCAFDENAVLIRAGVLVRRMTEAGFTGVERRYRIFFPGLLRALRPLEAHLTWLPLGAQYFVVGRA
ncbi:MAG: class I SAM-dependent methyltransferase [Desulfuromonadales bacterium]